MLCPFGCPRAAQRRFRVVRGAGEDNLGKSGDAADSKVRSVVFDAECDASQEEGHTVCVVGGRESSGSTAGTGTLCVDECTPSGFDASETVKWTAGRGGVGDGMPKRSVSVDCAACDSKFGGDVPPLWRRHGSE